MFVNNRSATPRRGARPRPERRFYYLLQRSDGPPVRRHPSMPGCGRPGAGGEAQGPGGLGVRRVGAAAGPAGQCRPGGADAARWVGTRVHHCAVCCGRRPSRQPCWPPLKTRNYKNTHEHIHSPALKPGPDRACPACPAGGADDPLRCLPIEALFVSLRRGEQLGFKSLG